MHETPRRRHIPIPIGQLTLRKSAMAPVDGLLLCLGPDLSCTCGLATKRVAWSPSMSRIQRRSHPSTRRDNIGDPTCWGSEPSQPVMSVGSSARCVSALECRATYLRLCVPSWCCPLRPHGPLVQPSSSGPMHATRTPPLSGSRVPVCVHVLSPRSFLFEPPPWARAQSENVLR